MKRGQDLYSKHTQTIHEFLASMDPVWEGAPTDLHNRVYNMLVELLRIWSVNNHTAQVWKDVKVMNFVHYIFLYGLNEASDIRIEVGIGQNGLFLNMNIAHPENFLKMKDDFWLEWIELTKFGSFELEDPEEFTKSQMNKYPHIFRNKKSSLLILMRNIIAFPMLNNGFEGGLDKITVTWPPKKYEFAEVIQLGSQAFERMWNLNQRLAKGK